MTRSLTTPPCTLPPPPRGSRPLSQSEERWHGAWWHVPSGSALGHSAGQRVEGKKVCSPQDKSPLTNILAFLMLCNLLLLKAASTWNHFLVCLLAGNFSQLFYLFETRSLPVSFCLKSSILTWNPLSVLPIYAEELALEDLLILRAPFSLLDS